MGDARASAGRWPRRVEGGWLHGPRVDLAILALPVLVAVAVAVAARAGGAPHGADKVYAGWIAQFILGNSTHVILTFMLLGTRRDVLHATPGQARAVVLGTTATLLVTFSLFLWTERRFPFWTDFTSSIVILFGTHHVLSQARGIWSLYNLRGARSGIGPPGESERRGQRLFVPVGLSLVMTKWLFVPKASDAMFPFLQAIPLEPAVLPFEVTWLLFAAWIGFAVFVGRAVLAAPAVTVPKLVYVGSYVVGVALMIVAPIWGATVTAGIHGLEYYFLCARMLEPTPAEPRARLRGRLIWPAMILAMLPLLVVGLGNAPFSAALGLGAFAPAFAIGRVALNAVVMAHYCADALIYRFRIPEVRHVALARLGFAG